MRTLALAVFVLLPACVTSGSVEDAQMAALKCHQKLRAQQEDDEPGAAATRDKCEELDLKAQQLDARHERQRSAFQQMSQNQHHQVHCTSTKVGNSVDTDCED